MNIAVLISHMLLFSPPVLRFPSKGLVQAFEVFCKIGPGTWGDPCPSYSWLCSTPTLKLPDIRERHERESELLLQEMHLLRVPDKGRNYQDQAVLRTKS